jgi:hypothetical protein
MRWMYLSLLLNLPSHVLCAVLAAEVFAMVRARSVHCWKRLRDLLRRCRRR